MRKTYEVFISHSSLDKEIANQLCKYLEDNGISCWIAPRDVNAGNDYGSEISTGIEHSGIFFLLLTENANASGHITNEVNLAFNKRKTIIPFMVSDFTLSKSLDYYLGKSHWIKAGSTPEKYFGQLLKQIQLSLELVTKKEDKGAIKAVLQSISPEHLTVVIDEEVFDISNSLHRLKELLDKNESSFFAFNKHVYNIKSITEVPFNLLTGKTAFNQFLTKSLIEGIKSICPAAERFSERVYHRENWETELRISDKAKEIIAYSFAGIVGRELSKLMAIGKEPFSEAKQNKYVEKCIHIVKRSLDLIIFALLSELWDATQEKPIDFSESERRLLDNRLDAPFEPDIGEQAELLFTLIEIFTREHHILQLPVPELSTLVDGHVKKLEVISICHNIEKLQSDQHDIQDCYEAEQNLASFLGYFRFLALYRMASVKVISYRQIKNFKPGFVHRYIALGIDSKANVDAEKVEYNQDASYSDSVLIFKGDDFRKSINLFPFVVDYNSINFEQGSNICFYKTSQVDGKSLEYFSLETNKPVIFEKSGLLEQKKDFSDLLSDAENTKLLNKECVYDRFMEARRCILNEISFDDL